MFDHWTLVDGDPLAEGPNPLLDEIITPIRIAKGLPADIPQLKRYMDFVQEAGTQLQHLSHAAADLEAGEQED
jgi:hypothetical protein